MIGTGGSALVAHERWAREIRRGPTRYFPMLIYVTLLLGVAACGGGACCSLRPIGTVALGAQGPMLEDCVLYGRHPAARHSCAFMLQNVFQSFFITAERPRLGLIVTVAAGVTNMMLDALFIAGVRTGGWRARRWPPVISQLVGGVFPLVVLPVGPTRACCDFAGALREDLRALRRACAERLLRADDQPVRRRWSTCSTTSS